MAVPKVSVLVPVFNGENHLAECHDCTVVVDTLRKTISLYHTSAANPEELPGVVRERLFRTLHLDDFTHP